MNISFECVQCEADFELELADLLQDPTLVLCPNCGRKADSRVVESAANALDELLLQLTRLKRKFKVIFSLESDEVTGESDEYAKEDDDRETLWSDEPDQNEDEEEE